MEHVQPLTGKGVGGLEHCPPITHFDLTVEEFRQLIEQPAETLARVGVGPGAIPGLESAAIPYITLARPAEAFSETEGWAPAGRITGFCCHAQGDGGAVCYAHG